MRSAPELFTDLARDRETSFIALLVDRRAVRTYSVFMTTYQTVYDAEYARMRALGHGEAFCTMAALYAAHAVIAP